MKENDPPLLECYGAPGTGAASSLKGPGSLWPLFWGLLASCRRTGAETGCYERDPDAYYWRSLNTTESRDDSSGESHR
jgi:hypothetical protein